MSSYLSRAFAAVALFVAVVSGSVTRGSAAESPRIKLLFWATGDIIGPPIASSRSSRCLPGAALTSSIPKTWAI